ncbi:Protein of unknown function [Modicisalibacter muralis]|uniref:Uncharacterized protein n=1 Tax=Modicisalibacter muralis TaxID=119000 RepID=A0A1G9FEW3_9GAMM|nr:DUF1161 domain-containing protein [Halomonas muralis]SDK86900.1 Protein of unknown function [Halomonas muralis]
MKRIMGILSLAVMASPAMAQTMQSAPDIDERVLRILKAATTVEPMALPASDPSSEIEPLQAEQIQAQQPDKTSKPQPDSGPIPQSCADLRAEIERKIRANDVPRFTLEVVPTLEAESLVALAGDRQNDAEIVGSCHAGRYKVIYRRG